MNEPTSTVGWTQPSLTLIDNNDEHLDDCLCDECVDNKLIEQIENRRAS